jgi:hypothetical protein
MRATQRKYATYNIISKDLGERGDQNQMTYIVPKLTNQYKYVPLIRCIS